MPINLIFFLLPSFFLSFFLFLFLFLWPQTQGDPPALVFHILGLQKYTTLHTLHSFHLAFKSALKLSSQVI